MSFIIPPPTKPMSIDEVIETLPSLRQSLLSKYDDCPLSAYFEMKMASGWHTHPQAAGVIFHRVAAEILRELQRHDSEFVPKGVALAILEDALEQRGIPPEEKVRVPLRDIPLLRMTVAKFANDNRFSTRQIVDIERQIAADLVYADDEGTVRTRTITGTLDALVGDPADEEGAIVIDWKNTWARPPKGDPDAAWEDPDKPKLSYHGFFQLKLYGWLVMRNYPTVKRVTLREFYPRRTEARKATVARSELEKIEKDLSDLALDFDRTYASGKPKRLRFPGVAPWNPEPGKHCYFCAAAHRCPIKHDARTKYAINTPEKAKRAVAELQVANAIREHHRGGLRPYVEENGPVAAKWSKGRLVFGLMTQRNGTPALRFFDVAEHPADASPRREPGDRKLEAALRRAADSARNGSNGGDDVPTAPTSDRPGGART